jgi:hypothetical protein
MRDREGFMSKVSTYMDTHPTTNGGRVLPTLRKVQFGFPGALHEVTNCWVYVPKTPRGVVMLVAFFNNFTPFDLLCKVLLEDEVVVLGAGASIQFNADRCVGDQLGGTIDLQHHGQVNARGTISRANLMAGFRLHAPAAFGALGGDAFFRRWPVVLGSTAAPDRLLDTLFLYAYGVEQVKRLKREEAALPGW